MPRLFISHSGADSFEAIAIHEWLLREGWSDDDIFIDLHDIGAGSRWKEALAKANENCEAVVFLASPQSLASTECRLELRMAEDYGKEIIVAILNLLTPDSKELDVYRERQIVDLSIEPRDATFTVEWKGQQKAVTFNTITLRRIKGRLDQLGISPESFVWRPAPLDIASPYPGLTGFDESEAALFFGRGGDIVRCLSEVRRLKRLEASQIMVIQAASGAGKSSFLRAGLWPRLKRDSDFLPLAILRPATGIITGDHGVGRQLASFFAANHEPLKASQIHQMLNGDIETASDALIGLINQATTIAHTILQTARTDALRPTPVIAVDQAEELFAARDVEESNRFLDIVARVLAPVRPGTRPGAQALLSPLIFLWTMRADSMDTMLRSTDRKGLKSPHPFLLPPIARDAYRKIIEAPLQIANQTGMKTSIEPLLVDELVKGSAGADALPLLAFTLHQLFEESRTGIQVKLTLQDFDTAGGINGVLSKRLNAAQGAAGTADNDLRRLIIPHLATWDEEARPPAAKRLVAEEEALFKVERSDLKPFADALVEARLLTRSVGTDDKPSLEVAHEALLRMPPVADWLAEDREFLIWRYRLAKANAAYEANTRGLLIGRELQIARQWIAARAERGDIAPAEWAFVEASAAEDRQRRDAEEEREKKRQEAEFAANRSQEREAAAANIAKSSKRVAQRTMIGLAVSLVLTAVAGGVGWYASAQQQAAVREAAKATTQAMRAELATNETKKLREQTQITEAGLVANLAQKTLDAPENRGDATTAALLAFEALPDTVAGVQRPYVTDVRLQLDRSFRELREDRVLAHDGTVWSAIFSPNGTQVVTASLDKTARLWDAATGKELARFAHDGKVLSAAFSPDGTRVATVSEDRTARLWDVKTGKELVRFHHDNTVWRAVFSPEGTRVATVSDDKTARLWDVKTGKELARLQHDGPVWNTAFSPDGTRIATASYDMTARIWDTATGKELIKPLRHDDRVLSAAFSADGTRIVTASSDKTARIWDAATGAQLASLAHDGIVWRAAFSPDGKQVVTASYDDTARLWDAATAKELARFTHDGSVVSVAFSPDGTLVATASSDKTARLWEAATGKELARLAHDNWVLSVAFSPDGRRIVTASGLTARLWEVAAKEDTRLAHEGTVGSAAFSADGKQVITASDDKTARLWDTATGKEFARLVHDNAVGNASFSPDGTLVLATSDKTAWLWQVSSGKELARLTHDSAVWTAAFSPDGTRVLTASDDKTARLWQVASGKEIVHLNHEGAVWNASFSPDGTRVVTASADKTARVWETATGKELARLNHQGTVWRAAFSPDGMRVVTASSDKTARVWETATGKELTRFDHDDVVLSAAFSSDGTKVVTASTDNTARIWNAATGKEIARLTHDSTVWRAVFSPGGAQVATASLDKTARLWDATTGKELARLAHDGAVLGVAFSSDGTRLVTASEDKAAHLWRVFPSVQDLIDITKDNIPRCLTKLQRAQYFLPLKPPLWCVERRLWPYQGDEWQAWLPKRKAWLATREGPEPELPKSE